jgi:Tfp pilus assembly PilM family ATPase
MARKAKLEVVGMHSEPLAILRAFEHLYRRQSDVDRVTCFIDVGGATTKVIITHGTDMAFAKTIHFAGDHFTRQVAQAKSISFSEARLARRQGSAAPEKEGSREPAEAVMAGAVGEAQPPPANAGMIAIAPPSAEGGGVDKPAVGRGGGGDESDALDCLLDELQMSVRYHQSTFPDKPIEKLIFLGGESRHVWVCQKIARALRIGAQLGDPIARLVRVNAVDETEGVDLQQPQPGWAVPMGLCLSEANL